MTDRPRGANERDPTIADGVENHPAAPFTTPGYRGYVLNGTSEQMDYHLAMIVATERTHGIRPLERMPENE